MVKYLYLTYFVILLSVGFSQELYPINKDGKWGLMDVSGAIKLEPVYDYLEYQREGNKFVFDKRGTYGAIDQLGEIYFEGEFDSIQFYTPDIAACKKDSRWFLYQDKRAVSEEGYQKIGKVNDQIFKLHGRSGFQLYHITEQRITENSFVDWEDLRGMLKANSADQKFDLFRYEDMSPLADSVIKINWKLGRIGIIKYADSVQLMHEKKQSILTEKLVSAEFQLLDWYLCKKDTGSIVLNVRTGSRYSIRNIDELLDISTNLLSFKLKRKCGAINLRTGKTVIPPEYDGIAIKNNMIYITNGSDYGIATASGKIIIEPKYENILDFEKIYVVQKDGKYGMASRSGKLIEDCKYDRIEVFDKNVKCYRGKKLTTINMDAAGNLKDRTEYSSYMTLHFTRPRMSNGNARNLNFGGANSGDRDKKKLNKYGWFQREIERQKGDSTYIVHGNWGLFDQNDSIRIRYIFREVKIEKLRFGDNTREYSICYKKRRLKNYGSDRAKLVCIAREWFYQIGENKAYANSRFQLVDHHTYRFINKNKFLSIRFYDWKNHALARGFTNHPVLIDSLGNALIDSIKYFGETYHEGKLRICRNGKYVPLKRADRRYNALSAWEFFNNFGMQAVTDIKYEEPNYMVHGGEWHFVDSTGRILNEKPFQFIYDFKNGRAIVQRGNRWGVVDTAMNEIVPIEYTWLQEYTVEGETFYRVGSILEDQYYYNKAKGTYRLTDVDEKKIEGLVEDKILYRSDHGLVYMDEDLNIIGKPPFAGREGKVGPYDIVKTEDAKYQLIGKDGQKLPLKFEQPNVIPIKYGRYLIKKGKYNFAVMDQNGNYVVPKYVGNKILFSSAEEFFYLDYNLNFKYESNGTVNIPKKAKILGAHGDQKIFLIKKKSKTMVYNYATGKIINKKADGLTGIVNAGYIFEQNRLKGIVSFSGDTILPAKYWSINYNEKGWAIAKFGDRKMHLINQEGQLIYQDTFEEIEQNYFRKDHYFVTTEAGKGVMNDEAKFVLPCEFSSIWNFHGMYHTVKAEQPDEYYQQDGQLAFKLKYRRPDNVVGFPPDAYVIADRTTNRTKKPRYYFYDGYMNRSMPFEYIKAVTPDSYLLKQKEVYGVYNYDGDTIVPIEYHKVVPLKGKFQVRFFNSFGYFDPDGKKLFDPKNTNN